MCFFFPSIFNYNINVYKKFEVFGFFLNKKNAKVFNLDYVISHNKR